MKPHCARWLTGLIFLATCLPCTADETPPFRYYKAISLDALDEEALVDATLDREIYRETQAQFADVRVMDDRGREVSYVIERAVERRTKTSRHWWRAENVDLTLGDDNALEISVRLDERDPAAEGIRLVTPLSNFEQSVSVAGSNDGRTWKTLVDEAVVFDYSQYMDVSNREIVLPKNAFRRFRIVIDRVTAEQESQLLELTRRLRGDREEERKERVTIQRRPFRVDRIEFWHSMSEELVRGDKKEIYIVAKSVVQDDKEKKQTRIRVLTHGEPITSLAVETDSRNFSRRATVRVPQKVGVRTNWREVGQATITHIDLPNLKRARFKIPIAENRSKEFLITIDNRDSPPLEITGIRAEGNVYRLLFFAAPGKTYEVRYGSDTAERPDYDTVALRAALESDVRPVSAALGDQRAADAPRAGRGVPLKHLLNDPAVYAIVIVLLVIALTWGLYQAVRRMERLPKDE